MLPDSSGNALSSANKAFIPDVRQMLVQDLLLSKQLDSVTCLGGVHPALEALVCSPVLMVCSYKQSG